MQFHLPVLRALILLCGLMAGLLSAVAPGFLFAEDPAQEPVPDLTLRQMDHTAWTARDGAPIGVNDIAADRDGTLWLATRGGLYRFDGLHFSIYLPPPGQPSLPSIEMRSVFMARDGALWVAPWLKDLIRIEGGHVRIFSQRDGLPAAVVSQILQAPDGAMWALIGNTLYRQQNGERWQEAFPAARELGQVTSFFFDHAGVLWIGTRSYLYFVPKGALAPVRTEEKCGSLYNFAETPDGGLWIIALAPHPAVRRVSVPGHLHASPLTFSADAAAMTADAQGNLWIGSTREGVIRLSAAGLAANQAGILGQKNVQTFNQPLGLSGIGVSAVYLDASGTVWAGTTRGLDRFRAPGLTRLPDPDVEGDVGVAACPNGTVWVGSSDFLLSTADGTTLTHHKLGELWGVYCDQESNLWFSRAGSIVEVKNGRERSFVSPMPDKPYGVSQFAGDEEELFAACAQSGLWRRARGTWEKLEVSGFPPEAPVVLTVERPGRVWTGYIDNKVGLLDGDQGKTFSVDTQPGIGNVQAILAGRIGVLAAGAHGLAALVGDHFRSLLTADVDAVQGVSGLVEDHRGDLWLNGARGVFRVSREELRSALTMPGYRMQTQRFSGEGLAGFPYQTYELPTAVIAPNGRIWIAMSSTAVYIDPDRVHRDMEPAITSIQGLLDNETPRYEVKPRIAPGNHTLRIRYFGAHLNAPERVSYRYLLVGQDQSWQEVGAGTEAVYTNLNPGPYTFRVAANNGDGVWSEAVRPLQFEVLPAFYQRWWFLALCAAAAMVLMVMAFRLRLQYATAQMRRRLEERAQERIRIARDLHDTLLQGIQGLVLCFHSDIEEVPEDQPARGMLEKTLTRAEEVIAEGRERVRTLRSEESTANHLPDALAQVSSLVRSSSAAPIEFLVEGEPRPLRTVVHDELYCIGREAITNALRHAAATRIEIEINYAPTHLRMRCRDNGKGMSKEQLDAGSPTGHWGVIGMKERASRIGARLDIWSTPGAGTEVDVSVPAATAYSVDGRRRRWAFLGR